MVSANRSADPIEISARLYDNREWKSSKYKYFRLRNYSYLRDCCNFFYIKILCSDTKNSV
jgi:hypothetical protein